jgi:transcriptional regulator with GAF, ATPase, and Fis domain
MEMQVDENEFFREATLRICGSLEIEKALWQCLLYVRRFMPVELMRFHVYDQRMGILQTVAQATPDGGEALSTKTPLPPQRFRELDYNHQAHVWVADRWAECGICSLLGSSLGGSCGSGIVMHLTVEGKAVGSLEVSSYQEEQFTEEHARLVKSLNDPFAIALANCLRYRKVLELKELLADDKRYLEDELRKAVGEEIIGVDFGLKGVMELVRQVSPLNSPVLLLGETGTGKEVIARAIHNSSPRKDGPFITVNCGAIPETLMDSELFGHEKGAFTGALALKRGRFERAHQGTIFLDEIGELTPEAQIRLLRVLQEKEIERLGGVGPIKVDIRVIAATHRDLEAMARVGSFRDDLYFRLKVFPISIPPLRERMIDIPTLVQHFMRKKSCEMGLRGIPTLAHGAIDRLMSYGWPGNVRELENAVERALILSEGKPLTFSDLGASSEKAAPTADERQPSESMKLDEVVSMHVHRALQMAGGKVEGKDGAAQMLGVKPGTLRQRMRKLGVPFGRKAKSRYRDK